MRRCQLAIDRSSRRNPGILFRRDWYVPVDREPFAAGAVSPGIRPGPADDGCARLPELAPFQQGAPGWSRRSQREELHDAAHGVGAVKVAAAPTLYFDPVDDDLRHLVPVDPPAERVVEWHTIDEDKRAALRRAADAAQRDAL
jgi:hypothetical protein